MYERQLPIHVLTRSQNAFRGLPMYDIISHHSNTNAESMIRQVKPTERFLRLVPFYRYTRLFCYRRDDSFDESECTPNADSISVQAYK